MLASKTMIRIYLFGRFQIYDGDGQKLASETLSGQNLSLLQLLVSSRGRTFSVDKLIEMFLPDKDYEKAQKTIRARISEIRTALEPERESGQSSCIESVGKGAYSFSQQAPCWIDIEQFDIEKKAGHQYRESKNWNQAVEHLQNAVDYYVDDFLPENSHDDWATALQDAYRDKAIEACCELAECLIELGKLDAALEASRKAIAVNGLPERPVRIQMLILAYLGQNQEAIDLYDEYRKNSDSYDLALSQNIDELYDQIKAGEKFSPPEPSTRHNLPAQLSDLIGREDEIRMITDALNTNHARMITVTGIGGVGKTHLVQDVASQLLDNYPDGVWFVALASIQEVSQVASAIANAMHVSEVPTQSMEETLRHVLESQAVLLVLDGCEHHLETKSFATLIENLLTASPQLQILASSRNTLGIDGEQLFSLDPLGLPNTGDDLETMRHAPSVQLFQQRAERAKLNEDTPFNVTAEDAHLVAAICRRTDGIPLALEFAAAQVPHMSLEALLKLFDDRLSSELKKKNATLEHHETLRTCIDWSYDLLDERERQLFNGLSVFQGGFTIEAAENVCASKGLEQRQVLGYLIQLVRKSLVHLDRQSNKSRYLLLDTLIQYGQEKLNESGQSDHLKNAHANSFLEIAEKVEPKISGADEGYWFRLLDRDHQNFLAAFEWLLGNKQYEETLRLCGALGQFWFFYGRVSEGRALSMRALQAGLGASKEIRAKVLKHAGSLATRQEDNDEAQELLLEALGLAHELGEKNRTAETLFNLGNTAFRLKDLQGARDYFEDALEILQELRIKPSIGLALNNLGVVANNQNDLDAAGRYYAESLAIQEELNYPRGIATVLSNLGRVQASNNNTKNARVHLSRCLILCKELGDKKIASDCLSSMAQVFHLEQQPILAAKAQGASRILLEEIGAVNTFSGQEFFEGMKKSIVQTLGERAYQQAFDEGKSLDFDEAVEIVKIAGKKI